MAKIKKALIVVHRDESEDDFRKIGRRIHKLDPSIAVAMFTSGVESRHLPPGFLDLPLLVVYLVNPPPTSFATAAKIAVRGMGKLEEYEHFRKAGLPCLPIERFNWGMELDSETYGEWVVLKPENITSTGRDVNMVPRRLIPTLRRDDFSKNHLIHQDGYLVQRLLKTGDYPTTYRATVFLGEILLSGYARLTFPYPPASADLGTLLSTSVATNLLAHRTREFVKDAEINAFALKVAETFPENPLLAIDILRDEETGQLYVLEVNLGGNTWHFSSAVSRTYPGYDDAARKAMVLQYNAWDRAAEALVRKTHELAK